MAIGAGRPNSNLAPDSVSAVELAANSVGVSEISTGAVGADEISTGAVGTDEIADASISATDIANLAVTLGKLAGDSVDSSKVVDLSIATADLAATSVTLAKLASDAVDTSKILDGTIATVDLGALSVTLAKMAADSVDSGKIVDSSIATADIGALAVTLAKLASNSVDASKIVDGSITIADLLQTGTPDATKFLRGDGTWATAGGSMPVFALRGHPGNATNIASATWFAPNWQDATELSDASSMHTANSAVVTIPSGQGGLWVLDCFMDWQTPTGTVTHDAQVKVNGTSQWLTSETVTTKKGQLISALPLSLAAGDQVTVEFRHNQGTAHGNDGMSREYIVLRRAA